MVSIHSCAAPWQTAHLFDSLLDLALDLIRRSLQVPLQLFPLVLGLSARRLETPVVTVDAADLCGADQKHEEVDSRECHVPGLDDKAPARPDGACAHEGEVLGEGEGLGRAGEVGGAGEDHAPFHDGGPGCRGRTWSAVGMYAGVRLGDVDSRTKNAPSSAQWGCSRTFGSRRVRRARRRC